MEDFIVRPVRNAIVMLTNQCNCNCAYCFEERRPERMSLQTAKDTLKFIQSSHDSRPGFTFFGGEPMLEYDTIIKPLVEWSKTEFEIPTRFAMTTNGTLFDKERLDFLKQNNVRFMLSMDGGKASQSGNRPLKDGRDSFDVLMENVPYILQLWPNQSFRETLTTYNIDSLFDDIMFFNSIGAKRLMIVPDFFESWSEERISVLLAQIRKYEEYVIKSFKDGKRPFLFHEYGIAFRRIISAYTMKQRGAPRRSFESCKGCHQCGFGVRGSVSIDPTGDIYGCHHIKPLTHDSLFYLGDIYKGVDKARVRRLVAMYDQEKVGNEQCAECGLDGFCTGGCAPNNYQIYGDVNKVPPMFCTWYRAITDSAYRIVNALGEGQSPLFEQVFLESLKVEW